MAEQTNTLLSTEATRRKYLMSQLDHTLRDALVAEKICSVDRTDNYTIENPYGSTPTAQVTHLTGTYSVDAWTVTDDTLTVNTEFKVAEHVFDFEKIVTQFDVMASRLDQHAYVVASEIDDFVLNNLCEDATGTYSTPSGGFTTAANVITIMGNLLSKVAGYESAYRQTFLVIENTDLPGFITAGAAAAFNFADKVMNNGLRNTFPWMGVQVYVVRTGTFADETVGDTTYTNSGHRVFGVNGVSTYAHPRGVQYDEKGVTGKTGKEIVTYGYIGFKLWATKASLVVDITLV